MTGGMKGQLARRIDAGAFGLAMLGFCWWLHFATGEAGSLVRSQRGAPLPLLAVEAVAALLIVLGAPVLVGPLAFRLLRAALSGVVRLALLLTRPGAGRLRLRWAAAARRHLSGGVR